MAATHRWLGLGEFPKAPVVDYLTRSVAALYGFHRGLLLLVSRDPRRYRRIVSYIAWMNVFCRSSGLSAKGLQSSPSGSSLACSTGRYRASLSHPFEAFSFRLQRDYGVVLASECIGSRNGEHHYVTIRYLNGKMARLMSNADIIRLLSSDGGVQRLSMYVCHPEP